MKGVLHNRHHTQIVLPKVHGCAHSPVPIQRFQGELCGANAHAMCSKANIQGVMDEGQ